MLGVYRNGVELTDPTLLVGGLNGSAKLMSNEIDSEIEDGQIVYDNISESTNAFVIVNVLEGGRAGDCTHLLGLVKIDCKGVIYNIIGSLYIKMCMWETLYNVEKVYVVVQPANKGGLIIDIAKTPEEAEKLVELYESFDECCCFDMIRMEDIKCLM